MHDHEPNDCVVQRDQNRYQMVCHKHWVAGKQYERADESEARSLALTDAIAHVLGITVTSTFRS